MEFKVRDLDLAPKGDLLIEWATRHMPVLGKIRQRFQREKPLTGVRVGMCLHVTKETAVLVKTLVAGGAEVAICGCNPLSTQDEVAASLARSGVNVYAWRGETTDEYYWCINRVIDHNPQITLDDGADLVSTIHLKRTEALKNVRGGTEETTTGVMRLRAMEREGALKYPILAVNHSPIHWLVYHCPILKY